MMKNKFDKTRLGELAHKWKKGKLTSKEKIYLQDWENSHQDDMLDLPDHSGGPEAVKARMFTRVKAGMANQNVKTMRWSRVAAAASILLFLSIGVYFIVYKKPVQQITQNSTNHIKPGSSQATLTLANGQKIILTKAVSGMLAHQANAIIQVTSDNTISYKASVKGMLSNVEYNTLTTKIGEQLPYPLELADGTKVWLNAKSSIKFPTAFIGKDREVTITGEAYFEVAKDKTKPFRVISDKQKIEVLGTHFNVNAYEDESNTKTTLLEGSVKVTRLSANKPEDYRVLKPEQQSVLNERNFKISDVDTEDAVAWKNGYFVFENDSLETIMRKLERWYNVQVVYDGEFKKNKNKVIGMISRSAELSQILKMLENTDKFKFKCEGRRITIVK